MAVSASDLSPNVPPNLIAAAEGDTTASASPSPSWQEQDGLLRDLWLKNQTPQEISAALGRSVPAIMTRAARLGLPRRSAPGRKPGRRTFAETGDIITPSHTRTALRQPHEAYRETAPQTSLRICLMCLNKFESFGRHNRICSNCKGSSQYEAAASLPDINLPTV
jgi:hypothetical protein